MNRLDAARSSLIEDDSISMESGEWVIFRSLHEPHGPLKSERESRSLFETTPEAKQSCPNTVKMRTIYMTDKANFEQFYSVPLFIW